MIGWRQLDGRFCQSISLYVAREPDTWGAPAKGDMFSAGMEITKETLFSELRDWLFKGSQGPSGHFGGQNKWRNHYSRETKYEKWRWKYHNFAVKIEATTGRDKHIKVRKNSRKKQIFDELGDHKGIAEFLELRDCVYKDTQGPARHFGSQNKWRNYHCRGMKYEKGRGI